MRILGIESSCDDTAAAIVKDGREVLAAERMTSAKLQQQFGGVVPEVAAREHAMAILPVVQAVLTACQCAPDDLDAIAVTQGPGLVGALLVGVTFAKALGQAIDRPVIGVHHLEAHLYANALVAPIQFPALALIVSGGHTNLMYWQAHGRLKMLGQTRDDAAGEALDKGARLLGLGYPGGPEIERLAATVSHDVPFRLPVARIAGDSLDFSFSGLKTATAERVLAHPDAPCDVAKALQEAVVEALCRNLERAWLRVPVQHVYLAGGVSANQRLAECVRQWGKGVGAVIHVPPVEYCTDNAAMVGACGFYQFQLGSRLPLSQGPRTSWALGS
ncbi:MAG: tRNA (adenosine(37)-N6)-threonylcarbamoyltransferase complex transferase subunit TsaD [Sulfobacillus acidophilus]|uniref:tRNA N6-adenosine threonylcarbamoyltransferase n=1 Tax=Sulfobacillus acidophilus TaxID=53633 RepID=A0A2T2WDZ8_9FIRM|nr:MAG: tRNA (adenosine(37)-N6)-threonylcarbamoyltransferase complex transferase subunit TsaD [Sulfobacillus acidophilus]